ncbi:hypothetical protein V2J09_022893 [Rumex salicifolius]
MLQADSGPEEEQWKVYTISLCAVTSVYVTFVVVGAFLGERAVDYGVHKVWDYNNVGTLGWKLIPKCCHQGELISLYAMEMLRSQIPNEMQPNTECSASNLKNTAIVIKMRGFSQKLKYVSATSPWLTIVAVVLFNKELTWAGKCSVVDCFFLFFIV